MSSLALLWCVISDVMLEEVSVDCDADLGPKGISTLQKQRRSDDMTENSGRYTE